MTEENCGTCKKNTFVCLMESRGFALKEDVEYTREYTEEHGCPFSAWEENND